MKVAITPEARTDLMRIWSYVEQDSPRRAIGLIRDMMQHCDSLANMPLRYQLLPGHEDSGIRRLPHGSYVIYYRVLPDAIYVLHILHGAQDHLQVLFPDA